MRRCAVFAATFLCAWGVSAAKPSLDLRGYAGEAGAITVQRDGSTVDPYFTLQALLLAQEFGLAVEPYGTRWANWLIPQQKPDGTFDRFCQAGSVWAACKTADADDALLALWLKFLESMPTELARNPAWRKSHAAAQATLARLVDPRWHVYLVSPVYQHGLFMDNLEVWSYRPAHAATQGPAYPDFGNSIHKTFWDADGRRYLVSTQPEQKNTKHAFYPDAVAQLFPLLVDYPHVPGGARSWYLDWMKQHRAEWLQQVQHDFGWGIIALIAVKQRDLISASCWLRETQAYRKTLHWTLSDEVTAQVLARNRISPAVKEANCK